MRKNVVAWAALVFSLAALLTSQTFTKPVPAVQEIPAEGQKVARQLSEAFGAVADFVKPSVVQISTTRKGGIDLRGLNPFGGPGPGQGNGNGQPRQMTPEELKKFQEQMKRFFDEFGQNNPFDFDIEPQQLPMPGLQGTGSGFVFDNQGHILTNNHVIENSEKIRVTFHDGRTLTAKLIATDPKTDVAVIKVETTDYRPLPQGDSSGLKVGEWVLAVGSPFGLEQSVTAGIVSATGRSRLGILGQSGFEDFVQTDCAINPGNSGGPLVDLSGRVVAINTAIATGTRSNSGVGFSIPINLATEIASKLIKDGKVKRAQIGILFQELNDELIERYKLPADTKGIIVGNVLPNSPAAQAGLLAEDVIVKFQGEPIANTNAFRKKVADSPIGSKVNLEVLRDGKPRQVELALGDADDAKTELVRNEPAPAPAPRNPGNAPRRNRAAMNEIGLDLQELTPTLATQMGYPAETKGLVIAGLRQGSPAAKSGLQVGEVIDQVTKDKKLAPVTTLQDFQELARSNDEIVLHITTPDGGGRLVTLTKE